MILLEKHGISSLRRRGFHRAWLLPAVGVMFGFGATGHRPSIPANDFASPLGIDMVLAGNFAEMRSNHFHAGLDLKTDGREGLPVYAAADGWISRIKVSPVGYGNALYVAHSNGYTTVYAHLKSFSTPVDEYIHELQYARRRFDVDIYPQEGQFPVSAGDTIALSGNSGGSYAPHLHFEIRETAGQTPVNPLLFNLDIQDSLPPRIFRVKLYPDGPSSHVRLRRELHTAAPESASKEPVVVEVEKTSAGTYRLDGIPTVFAAGTVVLGIQAHDYHEGSSNRLGAYRITLEVDGSAVHRTTMDRVRFDQTRYINAHIDYEEYQQHRRWIQRSHALPGNRLPLYDTVQGGRISVAPGDVLKVRYVVQDAIGNTSVLEFDLHGEDAEPGTPTPELWDVVIPRDDAFTFTESDIRVRFAPNTFYDDQPFRYVRGPAPVGALSAEHRLHEDVAPLHNSMTVSIRADGLPADLREHALLGSTDDDGNVVSAGGSYDRGWVVARTRSFGRYFIVVDTTAPVIELLGVSADGRPSNPSAISLKVADDLSGLARYEGYLDGKWVLLEYDAKNDLLTYRPRVAPAPGLHKLGVIAVDDYGNESRRVFTLAY